MRQFMQGIFVIFIVFLGGLNALESADLPKFQVYSVILLGYIHKLIQCFFYFYFLIKTLPYWKL